MNEDSKIDPDKGIATIESQNGFTGNGQNAENEIPLRSIEEGTTVENVVDHQQVDMNTTEDDTVHRPTESRKRWLIVIAVTVILGCSSLQSTLQQTTVSFFEQMETSESTFFGQTNTNDSTFFGQTKIYESSFFGQTNANETKLFEQIKANESMTQSYVPATSASVADTVVTTQTITYSVFGPVSAALILVIGYRWVALIGGVLLGVGCLGAAYCNTCSIHLVTFLYGALPGMGQAMIFVSTTVAILEHFEKCRFIALLIPLLGVSFAIVLIYIFFLSYTSSITIITGQIHTWKSFLLSQAGGAGAVIPFSLVLKPLKLRMTDDRNSSILSRVFGIDGLKIYRNPALYTFVLVWCLWGGGYTILKSKLSSFRGRLIISFHLDYLLGVIFWLVPLIGICISCCIPRRVSLRSIIIIISVSCVTAGLLNLLGSQLYDYIYAIVFYGILGILKGVVALIFELAIPMVLGEEHVVMGAGFFVMGRGLGGVTMTLAADEIEKMTKTVDGCFYLAGAVFLCGFAFTVGTYLLIRRAKRIENTEPPQNSVK